MVSDEYQQAYVQEMDLLSVEQSDGSTMTNIATVKSVMIMQTLCRVIAKFTDIFRNSRAVVVKMVKP